MDYSYDKSRLNAIIESRGLTNVEIMNQLEWEFATPVSRLRNSSDPKLSSILLFCNRIGVDILDLVTDRSLAKVPQAAILESAEKTSFLLEKEKAVSDVRLEYEIKIRAIKERHQKYMFNLEKNLTDTYLKKTRALRENNFEIINQERERVESKYNQLLKEKDDEIIKLKAEVLMLNKMLEKHENPFPYTNVAERESPKYKKE